MSHEKLSVSAAVVTGATFLAAGAYYQLNRYVKNMLKLIQTNPYVYYERKDILKALDTEWIDVENAQPPTRMQDIMKYGFPGLDDIRLYSDFVLSFDRRNRVAHWVYEHLRSPLLNNACRRRADYQSDLNVPSAFRVGTEDYRNSGFDRGHLAAAGNHKCEQTHCNETFYLTNITPQVGKGFNQDAWNNLEIYVRELTERYGSVYVCTGPLYMPYRNRNGQISVEYEVIGPHTVAVPTHFFKVIIVESKLPNGKPYMEAYLMPNASIPNGMDLRTFLVDIRQIESAAGLQFFQGLRRSFFFGTNFSQRLQIYQRFE